MKAVFLLAVLLPMILGAPQERFLIGSFQIDLHLDKVLTLVEGFAHSGMGQSACVTACGAAVSATGIGALLTPLCGEACHIVLAKLK